MSTLRFIHCADLHLDRPFQGLHAVSPKIAERVRESTFLSFHRIIDAALEHQVDFIVIAGDLFDNQHYRLRAQARFRDEMKRLAKKGIEAFIVHGNHDPLDESHKPLFTERNVHGFGTNVEMIPFIKKGEVLAHMYGFSYGQRAVTDKMISLYKKQGDAPYHIGILHGNPEDGRDHAPYAPFTVSELLACEFDYWALGHIHKRLILHEDPPAVYPGDIQGLNRKETGEKGCMLVEMDGHGTTLTFISTADLGWHICEINISDMEITEQLLEGCLSEMESYRSEKNGELVVLILTGAGPLHHYVQEKENVEDLLAMLREDEQDRENFVWPCVCKVRTTLAWDRESLKEESHFIGDVLRMMDEEGLKGDPLSSLWKSRRARRFLTGLNEEEQQDLLKEAETLLLTELSSKED